MKKKGVSLITLVISIVVIIIIAGVAILESMNMGIISKARKANFLDKFDKYKTQLAVSLSNKQLLDPNMDYDDEDYKGEDMLKVIPSMLNEDIPYFVVRDGKLYFYSEDEEENEWATESGIIDMVLDFRHSSQNGNMTITINPKDKSATYTGYIYSIAPVGGSAVATSGTSPIEDASYTFTNLQYGVMYEVTVKATRVISAGETRDETVTKIVGKLLENDKGKVEFDGEPENWTNKDVYITITHPYAGVDGYKLQYCLTGFDTDWTDYTEPIKLEQNATVYGRIFYNGDTGNSEHSTEIEFIDKIPPTEPTSIDIQTTTNGIVVTATGSVDNHSGFNRYQYSLDNTNWQDENKFEGIKSGTAVSVYARAIDNANNASNSISNTGSTQGIGKVNIVPDCLTYTKNDVKVTIDHGAISGYELQYSYTGDKNDWHVYTEPLVLKENKTVFGRMYNSELDDEGDSQGLFDITIIDKYGPTTPTSVTLSMSINGVKAQAAGSVEVTGTGAVGFSHYEYSLTGKDNDWQTSNQFTNIKSETGVTVYARAVDKLGNVSEIKSSSGTTLGLGAVDFEGEPEDYTNKDINITLIHSAVDGYELQYSYTGNDNDWHAYTTPLVVSDNITIYGRMYNAALGDEGNSAATTQITRIDKLPPSKPTEVKITATTNGITAVASGSEDSQSGGVHYEYSLDDKTWKSSGEFTGIKSDTEVTVYARALDRLGNTSESYSNKGTTGSIGKVDIKPNYTTYTKNDVTVTLSHTGVSGYVLEYSYTADENDWHIYTEPLVVTENKTVYGRMYNYDLEDEGDSAHFYVISIIDKFGPTAPTDITLTFTTNTVKAVATGSVEQTGTGAVGFSHYEYSLDNKTWQKSNTFTGIKSDTDVTVYARGVDLLGNVSESYSSNGTTDTIDAVKIVPNYTTYTKNDVTVTLSHAVVEGYEIQYSYTGDENDWHTYTSPLILKDNATVYGRMYNSVLADESDQSLYDVTIIDKKGPTDPTSVTITSTTNTVTAVATGSVEVTGEGAIGFSHYEYSLDNKTWQKSNTFTGIKSATEVEVFARGVDLLGNASGSYSNKGSTDVIVVVDIDVDPDTYTNGNVTVTLSHAGITGYEIQYSYTGKASDWHKYTAPLVLTENKPVYARMYNSTLADESDQTSKDITTIDKQGPTQPTSVTLTFGTNTVKAVATGSVEVQGKGAVGFSHYEYSINSIDWQKDNTFKNIKSSTNVTVYARAVDKLGNVSKITTDDGTTSALGKVTFGGVPETWTQGPVTITLSHPYAGKDGYVLQYSYTADPEDPSAWVNYTSGIPVSENKSIYGRVYNSTLQDEGDSVNVSNITRIDKDPPSIPTSLSISSTTNGITVTASGSTEIVGSQFSHYEYSLDNVNWQTQNTFTNIKSGTEVTVYVRGVDNVGNKSQSYNGKGSTSKISEKVAFGGVPTSWTKGPVTITLSHSYAGKNGYVLQYSYTGDSEDPNAWVKYTGGITVSENKSIYGRIYNSTLEDEGDSANSADITKIDTKGPNITALSHSSVTNSSFTINVTAADVAKTSTNACSGIKNYSYYVDGSLYSTTTSTTCKVSGITAGNNHTYYVIARDNALNETTSDTKSLTTLATYAITYDANGGTGAPASQTKIQGTNITLSSTKPTRAGYTFLGWNTTSTATTANSSYAPGATYSTNAALKLYAIWQLNTLSFTGNGEYAFGSTQHITYSTGTISKKDSGDVTDIILTLPSGGYTISGTSSSNVNGKVTFKNSAGTVTTIFNGIGVSGSKAITEAGTVTFSGAGTINITITANSVKVPLSMNAYTVTYNQNGGSNSNIVNMVEKGKSTTTETGTTYNGYTFLGWSESSTATSATYSAGQSITPSKNMTLYAVWKIKTLTFTGSGSGSYTLTTGTLQRTTSESGSLVITIPSGGYKVVASTTGGTVVYKKTSNSSSTTYASGTNTGTTYTITEAGTLTLTGLSKVVLTTTAGTSVPMSYSGYTITYSANGGTTSKTTKRLVKAGSSITLESNFATKSGYTLSGWSESSTATSATYTASQTITPTRNMTLYAVWKQAHQHVTGCYHSHKTSCWTKTYHSHSTSCNSYVTVKCSSYDPTTYKTTYTVDQKCQLVYSHSSTLTGNAKSDGAVYSKCSRCGASLYVWDYQQTCGKTTSTVESEKLTCGYTEGQLICGY